MTNAPNTGQPPKSWLDAILQAAVKHRFFKPVALALFIVYFLVLVVLRWAGIVGTAEAVLGGVLIIYLAGATSLVTYFFKNLPELRKRSKLLPIVIELILAILLFVMALAAIAITIFLLMYLYCRLFGCDEPVPPRYSRNYIELETKTSIDELNLFERVTDISDTNPVTQYLASMGRLPEWLQNGSRPPKDAKYQRVIFATSKGHGFTPPYQTIHGSVSAGIYQIVDGVAFLYRKDPGLANGVPVRSIRQTPFRVTLRSSSGGARIYDNRIDLVDPQKGEEVVLILHVSEPGRRDIQNEPTFSTSISVE